MGVDQTKNKAPLLVAVALSIGLISSQGCSLFQGRPSEMQDGNAFRATASTMQNPVPLPVEIVSDISTIQSGGQIRQEGVWRPTIAENGELRVDRILAPGETPPPANLGAPLAAKPTSSINTSS